MSIRWRLIFSLAVPLLLVLGVMAVVDFIGMRANALADMRRDLRGRYLRHPWPDAPWEAEPTQRAKPRGT